MQSKIVTGLLLGAFVASCLGGCVPQVGSPTGSYICEDIAELKALASIPAAAQRITILDSRLPKLASGAFSRFGGSLVYLNVTHSEVVEIPSGTFSGLNSLRDLILDNNEITLIKTEWIQDLTSLKTLLIWHNHITNIEPSVFDHLPHLEILDIAYNQIDHCLPTESLAKLKTLKIVYLTGNPWPLRCRPEVISHLQNQNVQVINTWGHSHILILECLAHEPHARYDDGVLEECVRNSEAELHLPSPDTVTTSRPALLHAA